MKKIERLEKVKIEDNFYWFDKRTGNKWQVRLYTKEKAERCMATLYNCFDCTNCSLCEHCTDCFNCKYCRHCKSCVNSEFLDFCNNLYKSEWCANCNSDSYLSHQWVKNI